jgi:hypothetical protein
MWEHQECSVSSDGNLVQSFLDIPEAETELGCINLPGQTRVCLVKAVLGTFLTNNLQVSMPGVHDRQTSAM